MGRERIVLSSRAHPPIDTLEFFFSRKKYESIIEVQKYKAKPENSIRLPDAYAPFIKNRQTKLTKTIAHTSP
jgi:hypothetical protein